MNGHTTIRTSPFGEEYLGKCINCGEENIPIDDMSTCLVETGLAEDLIELLNLNDFENIEDAISGQEG